MPQNRNDHHVLDSTEAKAAMDQRLPFRPVRRFFARLSETLSLLEMLAIAVIALVMALGLVYRVLAD
jgi:hypothetical protein